MGDRYNLSGDFRGAILNIESTLKNVQQSIGAMHTEDTAAKEELQALIAQLGETLKEAPPEKSEEAEAVAEAAKSLVEKAAAEKPNQTSIKITGEGLKQAAENLAGVMPTVLAIATQIIVAVSRVTGMVR
jgi:hypothetical protein